MKIGDRVFWSSQSLGFRTQKHGIIIAIVPPNVLPHGKVPNGLKLLNPGFSRDHESYLVQVRKISKLYWPRVCHLQLDLLPSSAAGDK